MDAVAEVGHVLMGLVRAHGHALGRAHELAPAVPMGRIGTPAECAEAILWLMSGEAAYMIDAILPVAGGR